MWVLSQYICMLKERDIPSAVLATVEDLQDVHPLLKKSMLPCGIGLPDEKERGNLPGTDVWRQGFAGAGAGI